MEELKLIYELITAVWKLIKKYGCSRLSDEQWEGFVADGQKLILKYRAEGAAVERLCRDLLDAFQTFMSRSEKGGRDNGK
nr:hypothetical protein [uncultured Acetatifactor sp.]